MNQKKSELSIDIIIIAAISVIVLTVIIITTTSLFKKNNENYNRQEEEINATINNKKCIDILSIGSRKCIETTNYKEFLDNGWIKVSGSFDDCIDKICIECPIGQVCQ